MPWVSSFGIFFSTRSLDQVRMSVAQTHANVKFGAAYTGLFAGLSGKTHIDVSDIATFRAMPGMTILAPADAAETAAMTRWATATPGPVYLRLGREAGPDVFGPDYVFEPRRVILLREGTEVLLVSTGQQTARTLAAAELLGDEGISAGVLHVPTIKPVDEAAIAAAAADVPLVVTRGGAHRDRWPGRAGGGDRDRQRATAADPHRDRGHVGRIGAQRLAPGASRAHAGARGGARAEGVEPGLI